MRQNRGILSKIKLQVYHNGWLALQKKKLAVRAASKDSNSKFKVNGNKLLLGSLEYDWIVLILLFLYFILGVFY